MTAIPRDPMQPTPMRVLSVRRELADVATLELAPPEPGFSFHPGQFNMLYAFGVGEAAISISGDCADSSRLVHTIRAVGAVSAALCAVEPGQSIGVRGPFGNPWPVEQVEGGDLVFMAGGLGLAPLRPAILYALAQRHRFGRVALLYGARSPADILYAEQLRLWAKALDLGMTVDRTDDQWQGNVGMVTTLLAAAEFDPARTTALVCGPEIMMRHCAMALERRGVPLGGIYLSMERNMKCGCGQCGHCQWGPHLMCKDGPVYPYERIASLLGVAEV